MTNVIVATNLYMCTCVVAGAFFFLRTFHRWPKVGLIHYPLTILAVAIAWPLFLGKGYV